VQWGGIPRAPALLDPSPLCPECGIQCHSQFGRWQGSLLTYPLPLKPPPPCALARTPNMGNKKKEELRSPRAAELKKAAIVRQKSGWGRGRGPWAPQHSDRR